MKRPSVQVRLWAPFPCQKGSLGYDYPTRWFVPQKRKIDYEELKRLHQAGWGRVRLAQHFGVRETTIRGIVRRLGLPAHKGAERKAPPDALLAADYQTAGCHVLAKQYGCSERVILRHLSRLGLVDPSRRHIRHHASTRVRQAFRRLHEFSAVVRKECFTRARGRCGCCGEPVTSWHVGTYHHILPIADGGNGSLDNCMLLHPECHKTHFEQLHNGRRWLFITNQLPDVTGKLPQVCSCGAPSLVRSGWCAKCCADKILLRQTEPLGVGPARLRRLTVLLCDQGLLPPIPRCCQCGKGKPLGVAQLCMHCWAPAIHELATTNTMREITATTGVSYHTVDMILHPRRSKGVDGDTPVS